MVVLDKNTTIFSFCERKNYAQKEKANPNPTVPAGVPSQRLLRHDSTGSSQIRRRPYHLRGHLPLYMGDPGISAADHRAGDPLPLRGQGKRNRSYLFPLRGQHGTAAHPPERHPQK